MTKTPTELAGNVVGAIDAALKVGADIDPLVLVSLPSKAKMPIANGNHRAAAAVAQGIKKVQAYIGSASVANEQDVLDAITEMQEPKYTEKGKADLGSAMRGFRTGLELEVKPQRGFWPLRSSPYSERCDSTTLTSLAIRRTLPYGGSRIGTRR